MIKHVFAAILVITVLILMGCPPEPTTPPTPTPPLDPQVNPVLSYDLPEYDEGTTILPSTKEEALLSVLYAPRHGFSIFFQALAEHLDLMESENNSRDFSFIHSEEINLEGELEIENEPVIAWGDYEAGYIRSIKGEYDGHLLMTLPHDGEGDLNLNIFMDFIVNQWEYMKEAIIRLKINLISDFNFEMADGNISSLTAEYALNFDLSAGFTIDGDWGGKYILTIKLADIHDFTIPPDAPLIEHLENLTPIIKLDLYDNSNTLKAAYTFTPIEIEDILYSF